MITLPVSYSFGATNKYTLYYFVKMNLVKNGAQQTLYIGSRPSGSVTVNYSGSSVITQTKYFGDVIENVGGQSSINAVGEMDYQINIQNGGSVSSRNDTSLLLLNQARFDQDYYYDIENQPIEVWVGFMPPSGTLHVDTDMICRYKGNTNNVGERDYERFLIPCIDRRNSDTKVIPSTKITKESYPNAPDENVGKVIPIVFGNFYSQGGDNTALSGWRDAIPAYEIDKHTKLFVVADHTLSNTNFSTIYKNSDMDGIISSPVNKMVSATPYTIQLTQGGTPGGSIYADFYITPTLLGSYATTPFGYTEFGWTASCDGNPTTYFQMSQNQTLYFAFDQKNAPGVPIAYGSILGLGYPSNPADFNIYVNNTTRTGGTYPTIHVYKRTRTIDGTATDTTVSGITADAEVDAWYFQGHANLNPFSSWDDLWGTEIGIVTNTGVTMKLYDVYVQVRSQLASLGSVVQVGRSLPSTTRTTGNVRHDVTAKTVGEVTDNVGTSLFAATCGAPMTTALTAGRSNGYSTDNYVDNPAYAIEWLLRNKLGKTSDDILTASFDAVGNKTTGARAGWKIATVLTEQKDTFDHINDICYEFGLICLPTANGKYKLIPMDSGSAVYTVSGSDFLFKDIPQISPMATPFENVYNSFNFKYRTDYFDNTAKSLRYLADNNGDNILESNLTGSYTPLRGSTYLDWLNESRTKYRTTNVLDLTLNMVRDDTTAEKVIRKFADWSAFQRIIVRMSLVNNLNTVKLEVGDIIKINSDTIGDAHSNVTGFIITRVNYPALQLTEDKDAVTNYIIIDAEEIPNVNTASPVVTAQFISSEDLAA
jgi:hypothetical protein